MSSFPKNSATCTHKIWCEVWSNTPPWGSFTSGSCRVRVFQYKHVRTGPCSCIPMYSCASMDMLTIPLLCKQHQASWLCLRSCTCACNCNKTRANLLSMLSVLFRVTHEKCGSDRWNKCLQVPVLIKSGEADKQHLLTQLQAQHTQMLKDVSLLPMFGNCKLLGNRVLFHVFRTESVSCSWFKVLKSCFPYFCFGNKRCDDNSVDIWTKRLQCWAINHLHIIPYIHCVCLRRHHRRRLAETSMFWISCTGGVALHMSCFSIMSTVLACGTVLARLSLVLLSSSQEAP